MSLCATNRRTTEKMHEHHMRALLLTLTQSRKQCRGRRLMTGQPALQFLPKIPILLLLLPVSLLHIGCEDGERDTPHGREANYHLKEQPQNIRKGIMEGTKGENHQPSSHSTHLGRLVIPLHDFSAAPPADHFSMAHPTKTEGWSRGERLETRNVRDTWHHVLPWEPNLTKLLDDPIMVARVALPIHSHLLCILCTEGKDHNNTPDISV